MRPSMPGFTVVVQSRHCVRQREASAVFVALNPALRLRSTLHAENFFTNISLRASPNMSSIDIYCEIVHSVTTNLKRLEL